MKTNISPALGCEVSSAPLTLELFAVRSKIIAIAVSFLKDRDEAEDVFQDVYLKIQSAQSRGFYLEGGKARAWILQVTRNHCTDLTRRGKNKKSVSTSFDQDIFEFIPSIDGTREDQLAHHEKLNRALACFKRLPENQKQVVFYRIYHQLSFKEIAEKCDISVNTALGRMRYAVMNMKKYYDGNK
ncbi:MAG: RNA polymerase sigma factor [Bacteroidia bacterium]